MLNKWIVYYDNVIHREDCDYIIVHPWVWKTSTYSSNEGEVKKSNERVRMDECWCKSKDSSYELLKKSVIKVMNQYAKDTPLKELHSTCVQDFSSAFCKLDEEEQKEVKNYIKICKESSVNPKEIQVSILEQIMKGSTEKTEPLHELVQKGMKDPSNIPGGGNKKFEFEKN